MSKLCEKSKISLNSIDRKTTFLLLLKRKSNNKNSLGLYSEDISPFPILSLILTSSFFRDQPLLKNYLELTVIICPPIQNRALNMGAWLIRMLGARNVKTCLRNVLIVETKTEEASDIQIIASWKS